MPFSGTQHTIIAELVLSGSNTAHIYAWLPQGAILLLHIALILNPPNHPQVLLAIYIWYMCIQAGVCLLVSCILAKMTEIQGR